MNAKQNLILWLVIMFIVGINGLYGQRNNVEQEGVIAKKIETRISVPIDNENWKFLHSNNKTDVFEYWLDIKKEIANYIIGKDTLRTEILDCEGVELYEISYKSRTYLGIRGHISGNSPYFYYEILDTMFRPMTRKSVVKTEYDMKYLKELIPK